MESYGSKSSIQSHCNFIMSQSLVLVCRQGQQPHKQLLDACQTTILVEPQP